MEEYLYSSLTAVVSARFITGTITALLQPFFHPYILKNPLKKKSKPKVASSNDLCHRT